MSKEIDRINNVIEAYFIKNKTLTIIPAKELMPAFIAAGIFKKDERNGKPIREVLRTLHKNHQLHLIPFVHAEHKEQNIYWYFIPKDATKPITQYKQEPASTTKQAAKEARMHSDEYYVIDLCDAVLKQKAERQKRFHFLVGDLHKDGKSRTQLPVDAYYESLNLVIEYKEAQHTETNDFFDKQDNKTVSGVHRGEQRKIYDERRATQLPLHGIKLIEIAYSVFNCDSQKRIVRDYENDVKKIENILEHEKIDFVSA